MKKFLAGLAAGTVFGTILTIGVGLLICEYTEDFRVEASGTDDAAVPEDFVE